MRIQSGLALLALVALSACGGGGGSTGTATLPNTNPQPNGAARAVASISFNVAKADPGSNVGTSTTTASSARKPQYLSSATDKFAFMLDGKEVVADQEVVNFNNAGPAGNGTFTDAATGSTVTLSYDGANPAYFTVGATIVTTPGTHKFGVVIKSGTPAYVLSEGQGTYTLQPTFTGQAPQALGALALTGAIGSGYIECDTWAQNVASPAGTCNSGENYSNGTYYFTAVAADFDGFPIVNQGIPFDNGGYSVVETDGNGIVTLGYNGPFTAPGNNLTGPSSGWVAGSTFQYGNRFTATCNKVGTASLGLQLASGQGAAALSPVDGYNYNGALPVATGYAQPSQTNGSILPLGSKTSVSSGRLPQYNVTVNCSASGTLTLI